MSNSVPDKAKSLGFITWMQMIGCVLVILGHSYPFVVEIATERILKLPFALVFPAMLIVGLVAPVIIICVVITVEKKTDTKLISKIIGR